MRDNAVPSSKKILWICFTIGVSSAIDSLVKVNWDGNSIKFYESPEKPRNEIFLPRTFLLEVSADS